MLGPPKNLFSKMPKENTSQHCKMAPLSYLVSLKPTDVDMLRETTLERADFGAGW